MPDKQRNLVHEPSKARGGRPPVDRYEAVDPWLVDFADKLFVDRLHMHQPLTPTAAIRQIAKDASDAAKLNASLREHGGIDGIKNSERATVIQSLIRLEPYLAVLAKSNELRSKKLRAKSEELLDKSKDLKSKGLSAKSKKLHAKSKELLARSKRPELHSFGTSERAIAIRLLRRLEQTVTRVKTPRGVKTAQYAPQFEHLALTRALDERRGRKRLGDTKRNKASRPFSRIVLGRPKINRRTI